MFANDPRRTWHSPNQVTAFVALYLVQRPISLASICYGLCRTASSEALGLMKRREFMTFLGCATLTPLPLRAQQSGKLVTIGFLGANTPATQSQWTAAFVNLLREL